VKAIFRPGTELTTIAEWVRSNVTPAV
jgi:hypothetical protein